MKVQPSKVTLADIRALRRQWKKKGRKMEFDQEMTPQREELLNCMAFLSEEYWSAGWLDHLTESLKYAVANDGSLGPAGFKMKEAHFQRLLSAHGAAGGWWEWDDKAPNIPGGFLSVHFVKDEA